MRPSRRASRHGVNALKARVKVRGLAAIDHRTVAARALLDWHRTLIDDLGGDQHISAAQLALVEVATRTKLYIDHADAFLLERPTLITRRKQFIPLVEQRQRLVDSLARLLSLLGLERRQPKALSLSEYLAARPGAEPEKGAEHAEKASGSTVKPEEGLDPTCHAPVAPRASEPVRQP